MPSLKKKIIPSKEQNLNDPEFEQRCHSTPDYKKFEVVTWQVNNIRHLINTPHRPRGPADRLTPLKHFIRDHGYPPVICLQDLRIHRSDEKIMTAIKNAVDAGDGPNYEVFFSLRGAAAAHFKYELREADGYVYKPSSYQPKKEISSEWAGVCTLVRQDWSACVVAEGTGQRQWDVEGRFLVLQLQTESWNMMIMNCFFPDVPRRDGFHDLVFQGPRTVDVIAAKEAGGAVLEQFIDVWMDEEREEYIALDPMVLRGMNYEEEVIQEMGTVEKTCHEFRAELHAHVMEEAKVYRDVKWHVLLIGSMNIMPRAWEYAEPKHRPNGYKAQGGHNAERVDFSKKFLDESQPDGFHGMDAWSVMNLKDPFIHYAIVNRELGETQALLEAKVLDHVLNKGAIYFNEHDEHVSKNVVLDLDCLSQTDANRSFSTEYSERRNDSFETTSHSTEKHVTPGSSVGYSGIDRSSMDGSTVGNFDAEGFPLGDINTNSYAYDTEGWNNGVDYTPY